MNSCLWIILLLACRGDSGWGCGNNRRNERCGNNRCRVGRDCGCDDECDCDMNYDRDNDCGCDMDYDHDSECGCQETRYDGNDGCDRNDYMMDRDDDCGCSDNGNRMSYDPHGRNDNDNRMAYDTYGCQENGIPCPPPVPGNYMR